MSEVQLFCDGLLTSTFLGLLVNSQVSVISGLPWL